MSHYQYYESLDEDLDTEGDSKFAHLFEFKHPLDGKAPEIDWGRDVPEGVEMRWAWMNRPAIAPIALGIEQQWNWLMPRILHHVWEWGTIAVVAALAPLCVITAVLRFAIPPKAAKWIHTKSARVVFACTVGLLLKLIPERIRLTK